MSYITTNRRNHRRHPLGATRLGSEGSSGGDSGGMSIQPVPAPDDRDTTLREKDLVEYAEQVSDEIEADPDEEMADDGGAVEAIPRLGQEKDADDEDADDEDADEDDDEPSYEILPVPSPGGAKTSIPSRGRVSTRGSVTAAEPDGGGGMSIMPVPTPGAELDAPDDGVLQIGQFAIPKWSIYAGAAVGGGLLLWALLRR